MPELPEVETIRRGLAAKVVGRTIESVDVRNPKIFVGNSEELVGRTIDTWERQGKLLIAILDNGQALTVHLKMTGQLIWRAEMSDEDEMADAVMGGHPSESYLEKLPHRHTRTVINFEDGSALYFNDLRMFGRITLLSEDELTKLTFIRTLGPEPLTKKFTVEYVTNQLKRKANTPIKAFLLDQTNLAGLGNIYADESLFRAAILPHRLAGSLTKGEVRNLVDSIQETLELAILYGGSSEKDYVNAVGEKGTFLRIANVYHRTGLDCNRCNTGKIERIKIAGRSTHFCPVCQR